MNDFTKAYMKGYKDGLAKQSTKCVEQSTEHVGEPVAWHEGRPPFPQDQEWFIAETIYGDKVVLRSLDDGRESKFTYKFTTADGTYMAEKNVKRWMQFPDCEYLPPDTTPQQRPSRSDIKPLTDERIDEIYFKSDLDIERQYNQLYAFVRAIEAAHGITSATDFKE
jgi:hypothetical protein